MALMHPTVGTAKAPSAGVLWATQEEYEMDPSMKLSTLVTICMHHMEEKDHNPPLMVNPVAPDEFLVNHEEYPPPSVYDLPYAHRSAIAAPDKIVVYACFPSQSNYIQHVLELYGLKSLFYNGTQTMAERAASLEAFRRSGRDGPRILILSGVGIYGLNVACANILVIVVRPLAVFRQLWLITFPQDTLWSAQDDRQLIGRIWRYPQQKQVHVYRLVADGTSDVFLNRISFSKGAMHDAFTNSLEATCKST